MFRLRVCTRLAAQLPRAALVNQIFQREIKRSVRPVLIELTKRKRMQKNPISQPRNKWIDWNRDAELYAFNQRLSEKFKTDLLEQAFTHRSYIIQEEDERKKVGLESQLQLVDNQELIDEGKQIASLVVENYLNEVLPLAPRECILALKNYLLAEGNLAKTSSGIGTKDLILTAEYPVSEETLMNTFYALVSALNRSVDLEHVGKFIRDIVISTLAEKDLIEIWCPEDPMEILNDILDREGRAYAESRIIGQTGVNTLIPVYNIAVYSNKEFLGSGMGDSIEEAEKMAALNALLRMFDLLDSSKPISCNLPIRDAECNSSLESWKRSDKV
ncbi:hypothetical protein TKK_0012926 [Trichogramma kaykai]|uniref:Large ribosomal subunit protein mL44 n=1 Tax=Trichogramma kaykai TaxID=54128 RepID=A0ABD2WLF2_9HYME